MAGSSTGSKLCPHHNTEFEEKMPTGDMLIKY